MIIMAYFKHLGIHLGYIKKFRLQSCKGKVLTSATHIPVLPVWFTV